MANANNRVERISVGRSERTYHQGNDPNGQNFLMDVCRSFVYGSTAVEANERLGHHMQEERVERPQYMERTAGDLTTSGLGGLVVPQYLVEMYAPATANLRPLANNMNRHQLPVQGMSLVVPRITTPTSAALQTTQLTAVSATSAVETDLTVSVQTAAGQQNVSRQALDRGYGIGDMVMQDLFRRVATAIDSTIINQASTGLLAVGQTTTLATVGQTNLYTSLYQAQSLLEQALVGVAVPDKVFMHSRRLNWLVSAIGSTWPLIGGSNIPAQSAGAIVSNEYNSGERLVLPNGIRVYADNNIPTNLGVGTNQDPVIMLASEEAHLWEDSNAPVFIRAEQPNAPNLGVLLVAFEYFAYTFGRYSNNPGIVNGAGLVAPAGF
jgi:hypothetical protein